MTKVPRLWYTDYIEEKHFYSSNYLLTIFAELLCAATVKYAYPKTFTNNKAWVTLHLLVIINLLSWYRVKSCLVFDNDAVVP